MNTKEAAEALGLTIAGIRYLIRKGRLKTTKGAGRGYGHDHNISAEEIERMRTRRKPGRPRKTVS